MAFATRRWAGALLRQTTGRSALAAPSPAWRRIAQPSLPTAQLCLQRFFASDGGRKEGTVKMWSEEKGFGFIVPSTGGDDIFFHKSVLADGLQAKLSAGTQVTFEAEWDDRRRKDRAADIQLLEGGGGGDVGTSAPPSHQAATSSPSSSPRAARGRSAPKGHNIVTAAANWHITETPMGPDPVGRAMVHQRLTIRAEAPKGSSPDVRREEFQLVGDGSWDTRYFPAGPDREEVVVLQPGGPGSRAADDRGRGHGRNWAVEGQPGENFDVFFDPQEMMVTCEKSA